MKGPTTAAVDRIVTDVVAPALKARGFRRRGRLWAHASDTVHRGLTVQRSQLNDPVSGRFTLNVRFAFLALGHEPFLADRPSAAALDGRGLARYIGRGDWWDIHDTRSGPAVDAFVRRFTQDWDERILPLLDHDRAVEVLRWAVEVYLPSREARRSDREKAHAFATRLGLDPTTVALS